MRFETGSSSDALLARCEHAYTCGRGLTRSRAAVANTTGVSSTTVASRLSTAVVAAAAANTSASSRRGSPRAPTAIAAPSASNSPARRHPSASTSSAARNPTVGPRSLERAARVARAQHAGRDEQRRGSRGDRPVRNPARPRHRGPERRGERHDGEGGAQRASACKG